MRNKILIVEDEPGIAESLRYLLDSEGFETLWVDTMGEARRKLGLFQPDLVVLDIGLPDGNGTEFCKEIRNSEWESLPVLFLTARQEEIDKIIALEIGGDDYVTKPFSGREVSARIKAILRRTKLSDLGEISSGEPRFPGNSSLDDTLPILINERSACVELNGENIDLSRNEYHLFKLLFDHPGQVFSRAQIMKSVWEVPESSMERTVDSHVKSLRKKLSPINCIQTQRGFGYKFEWVEE